MLFDALVVAVETYLPESELDTDNRQVTPINISSCPTYDLGERSFP